MTNKIIFLCFILSGFYSLAQNEDAKIVTETEDVLVVSDSTAFIKKEYDALSPSKAAFYSAVLPGLGQAYNKKYWKIFQ